MRVSSPQETVSRSNVHIRINESPTIISKQPSVRVLIHAGLPKEQLAPKITLALAIRSIEVCNIYHADSIGQLCQCEVEKMIEERLSRHGP